MFVYDDTCWLTFEFLNEMTATDKRFLHKICYCKIQVGLFQYIKHRPWTPQREILLKHACCLAGISDWHVWDWHICNVLFLVFAYLTPRASFLLSWVYLVGTPTYFAACAAWLQHTQSKKFSAVIVQTIQCCHIQCCHSGMIYVKGSSLQVELKLWPHT